MEECKPLWIDCARQSLGGGDDEPGAGDERRGVALEGLADGGGLRRFSQPMLAAGVTVELLADRRSAVGEARSRC